MKIEKLKELSYKIITEYYNNNLDPFWEYLDEDVVWYGPAEGQIITSKKEMKKSWGLEKHNLTFTMNDIKVKGLPINSNACSVVMSYFVNTNYPNGVIHTHKQNINMIWSTRKVEDSNKKIIKKPFIIQMFIANIHTKNEKDTIYGIHSHDEHMNQLETSVSKRITVKSVAGTNYYLSTNSIIWIEKTNGGKHSMIHTQNEAIECIQTTSNILRQSDDYFVSPHISYLVNPLHIKKIERFKLTLDNDKILSISEKKYTKFKREVQNHLNNL